MAEQALKTLAFAQPTQCRRYEGRVAIVTGSAQGLGLVIARRLAEEGADIVACDIQEERLGRAAQDLQQGTNQRILPVAGNLSEAESRCGQPRARSGRGPGSPARGSPLSA
jgi:NAD(P)-dependent dehydrogenase (short-subunit alcohol dehydrogenase family)